MGVPSKKKAYELVAPPEGYDDFLIQLDSGCLLSFFSAESKRGSLVKIFAAELSNAEFSKLIKEMEAMVAASINSMQIKLVGFPSAVARVEACLEAFSLWLVSKRVIEKSSELVYYSKTHRLRLKIDQSPSGENTKPRIRVLIVDDSLTIRNLLRKILSTDPSLQVVAETGRPSEVARLIQESQPDVMTLDVHMPEMDGVTLLKGLMKSRPIATVMISSISMDDGPLILEALEAGAIDYIQKPSSSNLLSVAPMIVEKVKTASKAKLVKDSPFAHLPGKVEAINHTSVPIFIGSSTGGTEALRELLTALPKDIPPILIVQHIPREFSGAFARRLDTLCEFEVKEAEDGDEIRPGRVLIAPGGLHMHIARQDGRLNVRLDDSEPVNRHKPSVDVLFASAAKEYGRHALGVILTGMGNDGAKGLLLMQQNGSHTIAQDEQSSVVFGMPREAIRLGAAEKVLPLQEIAAQLVNWLR